jgi:RimJ/RimL family protein N-acetyltransferase
MPLKQPGPAYRIVTERLVIRCLHPADAQLVKEAVDASLDHLRPWMPWAQGEPTSLQTRIERIRRFRADFDLGKDFHYGIFDRDETRILGSAGLHCDVGKNARELGYWIHKDFVNCGLATEAAAALTRVGFEIEQLDRIEIRYGPDNIRSAAIPKKLGYTREATLRRRYPVGEGKMRDTVIWSLFADEYPATPAAIAAITAYDAAERQLI